MEYHLIKGAYKFTSTQRHWFKRLLEAYGTVWAREAYYGSSGILSGLIFISSIAIPTSGVSQKLVGRLQQEKVSTKAGIS